MKRVLVGVAVIIIIVLTVGLYKAKTDAAKARAHVRELEGQIEETQADLRALRAEIAHLESPERVEQLAASRLGLRPGDEAAPLPESAIDSALPAPRPHRTTQHP